MCPFTSTHLGDIAPQPEPTPEPQSKWSRRFWADLLERTVSTLIQSAIGTSILMGATEVDWSDGKVVWATIGAPTALAALKGILANMKDAESGASLLPAPPGPEVNPDADEDGGYPDQPQDDGFGGH